MEPPPKPSAALFEVYLRLRPQFSSSQLYPTLPIPDRFLTVEDSTEENAPTHITLNPPNDNRRRAVEKFGFTQVFEEDASQLDIFNGTGLLSLLEGVLGTKSHGSRDGLLATLGVTGSGKSHTILGSKSQRGLTQLSLDVLFRSIEDNIIDVANTSSLYASIAAADPSEAQVLSAQGFLDALYGVDFSASHNSSRATTPQIVRHPRNSNQTPYISLYPTLGSMSTVSPTKLGLFRETTIPSILAKSFPKPSFMTSTTATLKKNITKSPLKGEAMTTTPTKRRPLQRPSTMPQVPDISNITIPNDSKLEYAVLISMYEVYNDRIFDLLVPGNKTASAKDFRRRPLLFKPTEQSPDRKVVAGLRKIICGSMREALMVLEAGLQERRVAGTGSNSASSRSHGFFCVEIKKRRKGRSDSPWVGNALTVVDLAGSERARDAKTQGATLQEAGKINESLMYLGQCLQMQSDISTTAKPNLVPFRQCKLTELLFSNSFPSNSAHSSHQHHPQKALMIVTADPVGDFNATSQILRYSALAREVTVPRIPSVTSQISSGYPANHGAPRTYYNCGRSTPSDTERETMEIAALEIARMSEEIDGLRREVEYERQRRYEAEAHLQTAEERILDKEIEIREECYNEMEEQMKTGMMRWKAIWAEEADRNNDHLDRKIDILTRGIQIHEDGPGADNRVEELEDDNAKLRQQVAQLQRQLQQRSPSKKIVLGERENRMDADGMAESMGKLRIVSAGSPVKKMRKLGGKKWGLDEEEFM